MEGFDHDWTDAGLRRVAYYTNLPPGNYRFHVVAYEIDDPRHTSEQILSIQLRPHFYQAQWFLALCGIVALALAWGSYRLHLRNIRQRFTAVLDERNRLAREMHDTLIQGCVGVSALLEAASSALGVSSRISNELLDRARSEVRTAVDEARAAVWDLRNTSKRGQDVVKTVSRLVQQMTTEAGIPLKFSSSGTPVALGAECEWSLLMIIREALQNAIRHARPTSLSVVLDFCDERLCVDIEDDGCGFQPVPGSSPNGGHFGLIGMRERAQRLGGEFVVASLPGSGTQVHLRIPLAASGHRVARSQSEEASLR
jgi:signal transduction histidine kinase